MKVDGSTQAYVRGYTPEAPRAEQSARSEIRGTDRSESVTKREDQAATAKRTDGFDPTTYFSLSREAQIQITENMLKTAIGKEIGADLEKLGIDLSSGVEEDQSPEAVSGRIFDFASGMYEIYAQQRPELSEKERIDAFESTIRGAVDRGYAEAGHALAGMAHMSDEVKSVGDETIARVHDRFDEFFAKLREGLTKADEAAAA